MNDMNKAEAPRSPASYLYHSDTTVTIGGPTLTAVILCTVIGVVFGASFTYVIMSRSIVERDRAALRQPTLWGGLSAAQTRNYAGYLEAKGMTSSAIQEYERYIERYALNEVERTQVCLKIAELALSQGDNEKALRYAYFAELASPQSGMQPKIDEVILTALERSGDKDALVRETNARARSERKPAESAAPEGEKAKDHAEQLEVAIP